MARNTKFKITETANLDLLPEVRSKLSRINNSILVGSDLVIRTPLGKSFDPNVILSQFDKIFDSNLNFMNLVLQKLEKEQRDKFGPRSIQSPWSDIKDDFLSQFQIAEFPGNDNIYISGQQRLRPLSINNTLKKLKNSTNSGLPYLVRKGDLKSRYNDKFLADELSNKYPCVMFIRTQEQRKTRIVWGYPMSNTILEASYFFPLFDVRKTLPYRSSLLGPDNTAKRVTEIIKFVRNNEGYVVLSMDFSAYDKSVKPFHIERVFKSIKTFFQPNPVHYSQLDRICKTISDISIVSPDGIISGKHGLSSGSVFTNDVGSMVQKDISEDSKLIAIDDYTGDDSCVAVKSKDIEKYFKFFENQGFKINRGKTFESTDFAIYLQNLFHYDYIKEDGIIYGIYPIYRALNRLIFQERWSNFEDYSLIGKDYYSIRAISILENCKHHPLFEKFVEFIFNLDKYSLQYSEDAVSKYESYVNDTEGTSGLLFNQYSDDISGINSFETVKILKRLVSGNNKRS